MPRAWLDPPGRGRRRDRTGDPINHTSRDGDGNGWRQSKSAIALKPALRLACGSRRQTHHAARLRSPGRRARPFDGFNAKRGGAETRPQPRDGERHPMPTAWWYFHRYRANGVARQYKRGALARQTGSRQRWHGPPPWAPHDAPYGRSEG